MIPSAGGAKWSPLGVQKLAGPSGISRVLRCGVLCDWLWRHNKCSDVADAFGSIRGSPFDPTDFDGPVLDAQHTQQAWNIALTLACM